MEQTMAGILIETVVRAALRNLKEDPERGIRNLVDMALRFSGGRFQQDFFQAAQTMLANEDSPYYALVRDLTAYADPDRLVRFGMALGYNGCTRGAGRIRDSEARLGHHIPWTVLLQMDAGAPGRLARYGAAVSEGEGLGVCTWMLFASAAPETALELVQGHPDSAFFLFCEPEALSSGLIDGVSELKNLMPVLRYREEQTQVRAKLRALGVPCCAYYPYGEEDLAAICDGDLFAGVQQTRSVFTVLVPRRGCPEEVRSLARRAVERARSGQLYRTLPWELEGDNRRVGERISGDGCGVCFDAEGRLLDRDGEPVRPAVCLFEQGLAGALGRAGYPSPAGGSSW